MDFPEFFAKVPTISVHDGLTAFLGASASGVITYSYSDAVKLAGHSCPTVAGAYLMVRKGLAHLYGDQLPERGGIEVYMRGRPEQGTTGVMASVAQLLTGAAAEGGFGGIGADGRFGRRGLLRFGAPIEGILALRRRDTGKGVVLDLDTSSVPAEPAMMTLFPKALMGEANEEEQARFGGLWQKRVASMLLEKADDEELVRAADWEPPSAAGARAEWPTEGLSAYKRTADFTETSIPAGLLRHHSTRAGVYGCLNVLEGRLRFHDIPSGRDRILTKGTYRVIFPERKHEVEPIGKVRFFIEFWSHEGASVPTHTGTPVDQLPHAEA